MSGMVKNFLFSNGAQSDCCMAARLQSNRNWSCLLGKTVKRLWGPITHRQTAREVTATPWHCEKDCKYKVYLKLYLNIELVPRSKHSPSRLLTGQLMLYREINAVCSQIHTKHINTVCGQNVEFVNVKCCSYRAVNTLRLGYTN